MATGARSHVIGATVRLRAALTRDWYEVRASDGMGYAPGPGVGHVTARYDDSGYCALCEHSGRACPGPWYAVDFGDGDTSGFGGLYGACELEAA